MVDEPRDAWWLTEPVKGSLIFMALAIFGMLGSFILGAILSNALGGVVALAGVGLYVASMFRMFGALGRAPQLDENRRMLLRLMILMGPVPLLLSLRFSVFALPKEKVLVEGHFTRKGPVVACLFSLGGAALTFYTLGHDGTYYPLLVFVVPFFGLLGFVGLFAPHIFWANYAKKNGLEIDPAALTTANGLIGVGVVVGAVLNYILMRG